MPQVQKSAKNSGNMTEPLKLYYRPVVSLESGDCIGRMTELRVLSLDLGVLTPAEYRIVTNRSDQSISLATWALSKVAGRLSSDWSVRNNCWFSVYIPAKMLVTNRFQKRLDEMISKRGVNTKNLVIELSTEALYAKTEEIVGKMNELRSKYGIRFLLSEFGDEFCPFLRVNSLPFDYIVIDPLIDTDEALTNPQLRQMIGTVTGDKQLILGAENSEKLITKPENICFSHYLGDIKTLHIRRKFQ